MTNLYGQGTGLLDARSKGGTGVQSRAVRVLGGIRLRWDPWTALAGFTKRGRREYASQHRE